MKDRIQTKDVDDALVMRAIVEMTTVLDPRRGTWTSSATPWTLAEALGLPRKVISRKVDKLELKGYMAEGVCCCGECSGYYKASRAGYELAGVPYPMQVVR